LCQLLIQVCYLPLFTLMVFYNQPRGCWFNSFVCYSICIFGHSQGDSWQLSQSHDTRRQSVSAIPDSRVHRSSLRSKVSCLCGTTPRSVMTCWQIAIAPGQPLWPVLLSLYFSYYVVCSDFYWIDHSLEEMPLLFQGMDDSQHFFVIDLVILFNRGQGFTVEDY